MDILTHVNSQSTNVLFNGTENDLTTKWGKPCNVVHVHVPKALWSVWGFIELALSNTGT